MEFEFGTNWATYSRFVGDVFGSALAAEGIFAFFLESGFLALALRDQILPATLNLDNPSDDCDLDFVPHEPRKTDLDVAITNSFGFGGTNGAIVMRRV